MEDHSGRARGGQGSGKTSVLQTSKINFSSVIVFLKPYLGDSGGITCTFKFIHQSVKLG